MNVRKLLCACCAAIAMTALTGCPDEKDNPDASTGPGADASAKKDGSVGPGLDASVGPGLDASTVGLDACTPNCAGRECGEDGCGGTCGAACADGKTCNPAGMCVAKVCAPPVGPCGPDQYCDVTGDPACVEICGPTGCKVGETCEHNADGKTGTCKPPKCSETAEQCEQGQNCDWYWGSFNACTLDSECTSPEKCLDDGTGSGDKVCMYQACSCVPAYTDPDTGADVADTCAQYGLVCGMDTSVDVIQPAKCRMPEELDDCKTTVGCAQPADGGKMDCVALTDGAMCMRNCLNGTKQDSSLCTYDYFSCGGLGYKNHCYFNICADPGCVIGLFTNCTEASQRKNFLKPCSSGIALNDSTCTQQAFDEGGGNIFEYGLCFQGGKNTASGAECNTDGSRFTDGGPDYAKHCRPPTVDSSGNITQPGEFCISVEPVDPADPTKGTKGLCTPLCNAYTAAAPAPIPNAPCADSGDTCLDITLVPAVPSTWMGICMPKCDLFGSDVCPDDAFGNKQGCTPAYDFAGGGFCTALVDNAAGLNETCVYNSDDPRNACGDRLTCMQYTNETSGKCTGWCQSAKCADETVECAGCAGAKCCKPACTVGVCGGSDGCGGICGCAAGEKCGANNTCAACVPACTDKCNGQDDGCGGKCGCPTAGDLCDARAAVEVCYTPACTGLCSGQGDGHGGTCACPAGTKCDTTTTPGTEFCGACTTTCAANACNVSDGCGGTCGCVAGTTKCNTTTNLCEACSAACTGKCSGESDGCGGVCVCGAGKVCDTTPAVDACVTCVPNCYMKTCGDDGCGGSCGPACASDEKCAGVTSGQKCTPVMVNADQTAYVVTPVEACDYH